MRTARLFVIGIVAGASTLLGACARPAPVPARGVAPAPPPPEGPIVGSIAAGDAHTCAVSEAGRFLCWGAYRSDGLTERGAAAPQFVDDATDWAQVEAGVGLTCAQKTDGSLWCFASHDGGYGVDGEGLSGRPRRVGTATDWSSFSVGDTSVCGIRAGRASCLGRTEIVNAEKFDHEITDDLLEAVQGADDVVSVSAGLATICVVRANGELWCQGVLGQGERPATELTRVGSRTDWGHVALYGMNGCAVRKDNEVYCWAPREAVRSVGPRDAARLDVTTTTPEDLSVGNGHVCARTASGWQCWGSFAAGQRGAGVSSEQASPVDGDWSVVAAGGRHTCALREGQPFCWGDNAFGQLGLGVDGGPRGVPTPVDAEVKFGEIVSSTFDACGITTDDDLYCWGENGLGEFDDRARGSAARPRLRFTDSKWRDVGVSNSLRCGVRSDGTLWCWGFGTMRQLSEEAGWRAVEVRAADVCATRDDGSLWCWLDMPDGPPVQLAERGWMSDFSLVSYGVCGLVDGTGIQCVQTSPASARGRAWTLAPGEWVRFSAARSNACAIGADGAAVCFDADGKQPGMSTPRPEPLDPNAARARFTGVSVGPSHSCAIQSDGSLWCWGFDRAGALGLGELKTAKTPTRVGEKSWSFVRAGDESTCGITREGTAHCWGRHYIIGDGNWLQPEPTPVVPAVH